jgi:hypothetical protein
MRSSEAGSLDPADLTIVPANEATWADLAAIFGASDSGRCNCQRFKTRGWFWDQATDEQRRAQLRDQTNCDDPGAMSTTGLVGYLTEGRVPVGWVAVSRAPSTRGCSGCPPCGKGAPARTSRTRGSGP